MQPVYIAAANAEENLAEQLAAPVRAAGYQVAHNGTITIGESHVEEARKLLEQGSPIVVCATARAVGTTWTRKIVNAAQADDNGRTRVFVVQMEPDADVEHLALHTRIARYHEDPERAAQELVAALKKHFPLPPEGNPPTVAHIAEDRHFLDQPTDAVVDIESLIRFRGKLRQEVAQRYPATLTAWEFLDRAVLRIGDRLTWTGALLFAQNPMAVNPTTMVTCARYYGLDRGSNREIETITGTVPDQIIAARDFIATRVRRGEAPNQSQAQSAEVFEYPMVAVREIIANALAHRDYSTTETCVHVRLFPDRLEVTSPGLWRGRELTDGGKYQLADLVGQSIKPNYRLAHVLSWIRLVEGEGSGLPSALADCENMGSPAPVVVQEQGFITVTLRPRKLVDNVRNEIGSDVGNVVQAGSIHGGVHVHFPATTPPIPRQLPATPRNFVGREREIDQLNQWLDHDAGPTVITINGMAGIGKTAFALRWAHRNVDQFPDGQLFVDLRGFSPDAEPMSPDVAIRQSLLALGVEAGSIPIDVDAQVGLYRSLIAGRRMLLVLDNARETEQVRPLLPGTESCVVVVTSRRNLTDLVADGAGRLSLDELDQNAGYELLARQLGPQRVAAEPEAAAALVRLSGYLPLALRLLASVAADRPDMPLAELATDLSNRTDALDTLDEANRLRAVFSASIAGLSERQVDRFALLGLAPGPDISATAAAALIDDPGDVRRRLRELRLMSLLEETARGRYRMHDLLRLYAAELAPARFDAQQINEALLRLVDYYVRQASTVADSRWFEAEYANLLAVQQLAREHGWHTPVVQLAEALGEYQYRRGLLVDGLATWQAAVASAEATGDFAALQRANRGLGQCYSRLDRHAEALEPLRKARDLAEQIGERSARADTDLALAITHGGLGDDERALRYAIAAMEGYRAVQVEPEKEADALAVVARYLVRAGRYDEARDVLRGLPDRGEVLQTWGELASHRGDLREAISYYEQALDRYLELGHTYLEAELREQLAETFSRLGELEQAREHWERALALYQEQQRTNRIERVRTRLAKI